MKNNTKKKLLAAALSVVLLFALCACGGESAGEDGAYRVAIIKQMDHASLDEIADAVAARMEQIAAEQGIEIRCEITSGQGDQSMLKQLGDQAVAQGADVMIPIATTAAQVAALCAEESRTPVVYAAVSDPVEAGLVGLDYVTGTSDALNTALILDMMLKLNPDATRVGLLYSLSEPNSAAPIAEAKAYLDSRGIAYTEQTGNTNDEIIAAATALAAAGVDAVFTPTDNVVMAAELAIYESLIAAGIPHYTGADSFVRSGAFATCGVNYTELGYQTADIAYRAMTEGMAEMADFYTTSGGVITVNVETALALGLDYALLADLGTVVEVATTEH